MNYCEMLLAWLIYIRINRSEAQVSTGFWFVSDRVELGCPAVIQFKTSQKVVVQNLFRQKFI